MNKYKLEKELGLKLLDWLKKSCLCCKTTSCIGTCQTSNLGRVQCFNCLGNHRARDCKNDYKRILKDKAYYSCYCFNVDQSDANDFRECSKEGDIQERLRCLIHYAYKTERKNGSKQSYMNFLSGIYSSEQRYFHFLASFKDMM